MNDPPRVHICFGGTQVHLDELRQCEADRSSIQWTINKSALGGDQVAFYMRRPWSAFVATGIVDDQSQFEDDKSSDWYRHYMSDISKIQMLPRFVPISEAKERSTQWGWLRQPRRSTLVPSVLAEAFLGLLQAKEPSRPRPAEASDIEGMKTEIPQTRLKRSRRLRDLAFQAAKGICCVCELDFSRVLGGQGVRVLQVHHRKQLSFRDKPSITKLSDLAVVCANCHLLLHLDTEKALSVRELREMIHADSGSSTR